MIMSHIGKEHFFWIPEKVFFPNMGHYPPMRALHLLLLSIVYKKYYEAIVLLTKAQHQEE
jgi:hypothetical protein